MAVQTIRSLLGYPSAVPTVSDSVLVIIDAQNEYASGILKVAHVEESRKVIKALLEHYRSSGGVVIHVVADTPSGAPIFTPGTPSAEVLEELTPIAGEPIVHKVHASAFTVPAFKQELDKTGLKKIVVVGYMAHNCVSATIRTGTEQGFDLYVVSDAVDDRDIPNATADELIRVTLAEVADTVATVVESKDIL